MGVVGEVGLSSYCASKGALISGTKALALELGTRKQRINCVSPAMVKTEMLTREFSILSVQQIESKVNCLTILQTKIGLASQSEVQNQDDLQTMKQVVDLVYSGFSYRPSSLSRYSINRYVDIRRDVSHFSGNILQKDHSL